MTTAIPLRLADITHPWCDRAGTRLHHRLVLADSFREPMRLLRRGRPQSPFVVVRHFVIDRNLRLSTLEIVRRLDLELTCRGGCVLGLPESWTEHSGVTTYREAYKDERCRRRLASMIAKRRRISRLP